MEIARLNNLNEFELSCKKKWKSMDGEVVKYRSSYVALKLEHEELLSDNLRLVFN
jgi:hypothetical protein